MQLPLATSNRENRLVCRQNPTTFLNVFLFPFKFRNLPCRKKETNRLSSSQSRLQGFDDKGIVQSARPGLKLP